MLSAEAPQVNFTLVLDGAVATRFSGIEGAIVSGVEAAMVVTDAVFESADTLPALSAARTVKAYRVLGVKPVTV